MTSSRASGHEPGSYELFDVRASPHGGVGCFATRALAAGSLIWRFTGPMMTWHGVVDAIRAGTVRSTDDPLQLEEDWFMALDPPAIFFNHGCEPNAYMRTPSDLVALRDISVAEEILYDYSLTVSAGAQWAMRCRCGAKSCRRRIGGWSTVDRRVVRRNVQHGTIQDFIAREIAASSIAGRLRSLLRRAAVRFGPWRKPE